MKLFIFSDIHCDWQALKKIVSQKADLYLCLGDLTNFGQDLQKAGEILSALKEKLLLLPGNHETEEQINNLCKNYGFFNLHQKVKKIGDFSLAGFGCSTPTPFNTPCEKNEEVFRSNLQRFNNLSNLCLFCHNPPYKTQLDVLPSGVYVGSKAIRDFIEKEKPIYFFSGHIHENEGKIQHLFQTTCFSVGKKGFSLWL